LTVAGSEVVCAIHQPNFFPRLSTLAKLAAADVWVVLDDVQFARRDYQHRARLAALDSPEVQQWLTVPVHLPEGRATCIRDVVLVDPAKAQRRAERMLSHYYGRSVHWPTIQDHLDPVISQFNHTDHLATIAEASTRALLNAIGWNGTTIRASSHSVRSERSQRLADLTQVARATTYLYGTGGANYLDFAPFHAADLRLRQFTRPAEIEAADWLLARRITALHPLANATHPEYLRRILARARVQILDAG
jgi:hypothetical protein